MSRVIDSPMYSLSDGAKYMHLNSDTVRALVEMGELPAFELGAKKLSRSVMDKFIADNLGPDKGRELTAKVDAWKQKHKRRLHQGERIIEI